MNRHIFHLLSGAQIFEGLLDQLSDFGERLGTVFHDKVKFIQIKLSVPELGEKVFLVFSVAQLKRELAQILERSEGKMKVIIDGNPEMVERIMKPIRIIATGVWSFTLISGQDCLKVLDLVKNAQDVVDMAKSVMKVVHLILIEVEDHALKLYMVQMWVQYPFEDVQKVYETWIREQFDHRLHEEENGEIDFLISLANHIKNRVKGLKPVGWMRLHVSESKLHLDLTAKLHIEPGKISHGYHLLQW